MNSHSLPLLHVDLSSGASRRLEVPSETRRLYLGGASLAARLLWPLLTRSPDPLDPESPLLFLTGPLTGTAGPAVGRCVVAAWSPATRLWGESNVGGFLGPEIRAAGWDGILLTGRAPAPVYLLISDEQIELRSAVHLWGKADAVEVQAAIRSEVGLPGLRIAGIGLAGENRLPMANILVDHGRMAGRTGMGAIMGSKNLKALAIHGSFPIPVWDRSSFAAARRRANLALREDSFSLALRSSGSAAGSEYFDYVGMMPKRYFTRGTTDEPLQVTGTVMSERILSGVSTCHGCVIACGRKVRLSDGLERKGPEYETMVGFGPNLGINDLESVTRLGEMCDRYGLDAISVSNVIGLAMYFQQEGRLPRDDAGGLAPTWGEVPAVERLIDQIARQEGLGALLGRGARWVASRWDAPGEAAQVNGLEMAFHDPRGASGMALVYATSPRGACHNQGDYYMVEIGQSIEEIGVAHLARHAGAEKAASVARHQDWQTVLNSLVLCIFANVPTETTVELLNRATGWDYGLPELVLAGERGWNLKRLINGRLGLTAADDSLPDLVMRPLTDGPAAGYIPPLESMLESYYRVRGWDRIEGMPEAATRERLGLGWTAAGQELQADDPTGLPGVWG